jgi:Integrase core domain
MESFFHTLKTELVHHRHYATRADVTRNIFAYIEGSTIELVAIPPSASPIEMELKSSLTLSIFVGGRSQIGSEQAIPGRVRTHKCSKFLPPISMILKECSNLHLFSIA